VETSNCQKQSDDANFRAICLGYSKSVDRRPVTQIAFSGIDKRPPIYPVECNRPGRGPSTSVAHREKAPQSGVRKRSASARPEVSAAFTIRTDLNTHPLRAPTGRAHDLLETVVEASREILDAGLIKRRDGRSTGWDLQPLLGQHPKSLVAPGPAILPSRGRRFVGVTREWRPLEFVDKRHNLQTTRDQPLTAHSLLAAVQASASARFSPLADALVFMSALQCSRHKSSTYEQSAGHNDTPTLVARRAAPRARPPCPDLWGWLQHNPLS